ncbi:hypothetical protein [Burkholderia plantarii]|uniref:hypothetical protein n=1 Tax=Burkholderia plantarii TaxID=41899 RepID=UPI000F4E1670|nr:hypothetical protein [Burkholderia plantarii]
MTNFPPVESHRETGGARLCLRRPGRRGTRPGCIECCQTTTIDFALDIAREPVASAFAMAHHFFGRAQAQIGSLFDKNDACVPLLYDYFLEISQSTAAPVGANRRCRGVSLIDERIGPMRNFQSHNRVPHAVRAPGHANTLRCRINTSPPRHPRPR